MAEIFTLPGVELPDPSETKPSDISAYCRRLAELIDTGEVLVDAGVMVLRSGPYLYTQAICADPVETMGMLAFAQRMVK